MVVLVEANVPGFAFWRTLKAQKPSFIPRFNSIPTLEFFT